MAHHDAISPEGRANIKLARDTLISGDVVQMNIDCGNEVTKDYQGLLVLVLANSPHSRTCKILYRSIDETHEFLMHNDWCKIGHINNWQDMLK